MQLFLIIKSPKQKEKHLVAPNILQALHLMVVVVVVVMIPFLHSLRVHHTCMTDNPTLTGII